MPYLWQGMVACTLKNIFHNFIIVTKGIAAYPSCKEMTIVRCLTRLTGISGIAFLFVAMVSILLPNSTAKICFTPGSHIAIEEMDSECCGHRGVYDTAVLHSQSRMEATGSCGNCTDILIALLGPETIPVSPGATGIPSYECLQMLPTAESSASRSRQSSAGNEALDTAFSSLPLLC
jgi:hypothetical protein